MKSTIFIMLFFLLLTTSLQAQSVYDLNCKTSDSITQLIKGFPGKKILIVVLPTTQTSKDNSMLKQLDSISRVHTSDLKIIGVPSVEDGADKDHYASLKHFYRSILNDNIIITTYVNTRKTSTNQDKMFAWLSHAAQNNHFDSDVKSVWTMFILNEKGELKGVLGTSANFPLRILNRLLQ
jgi:glutathione peroxidase-family protein